MANEYMGRGRQGFANAEINWGTDDIKVLLVDATYTFDSAHEDLADIPGSARVATSSALTGKTSTGGILDADDPIFAGLTGDAVTQAYLFQDTGVEATSLLIVYWDTDATAAAISYTPDGTDLQFVFPNGTNRIVRI